MNILIVFSLLTRPTNINTKDNEENCDNLTLFKIDKRRYISQRFKVYRWQSDMPLYKRSFKFSQ